MTCKPPKMFASIPSSQDRVYLNFLEHARLWGFLLVMVIEFPRFDFCTKPWVTEILFIFHLRR